MKRLLAFAAIYVVWGSTYLAIRYAVESVPPLLMAGARFLSAGALLYAWARSSGVRPPRGREWRLATVLGGLFFVGGGGALAWAEQRVASGLAALLLAIGLAAGESARLELGAVSVRSVAALGYLIAFGSLASFTAYVWLLGVTEPSRVATYAFVNPVVAVVLGWAVGGEPLNGRTLIAAAVIVAAVTVIVAERSGLGAQPPRSAQRSEDRP